MAANDPNPNPDRPLDEIELTPGWVKAPAKTYADEQRSSRPERGRGPGPSHGLGHGKDDRPRGLRRPPGQDRPPGQNRPPGQDRPPREQRPLRPALDRRPPVESRPMAPVEVLFLPDEAGFAAMLDKMKHSLHAYPLFDVAKLVLGKPNRHQVQLRRLAGPDGTRPPLHIVALGQQVFLTRDEAVRWVMRHHLAQIAREVKTPVDPPKGNFTFVSRCGITGELLGPPNYHEYQTILVRHHQQRLRQKSFEEVKARIQTVRDPAIVQQWIETMSVRSQYGCALCAAAPATQPAVAPVAVAAPVTETLANPPGEIAPPPSEGERELPARSVEPETSSPGPAPSAPLFGSLGELEKHFLEKHLDQTIAAAPMATLSGSAVRDLEQRGLVNAIRETWETERRFPIKTVNELRPRLQKEGFHFFKHPEGVVYITQARLKRFDAAEPLSEQVRKILAFLRQTGGCTSKQLMAELLPAAATEPVPPEATTHVSAAEEPILADLRWLIGDAYVLELSNGRLWAPPEKVPPPPLANPVPAAPAPAAEENAAAAAPAPAGSSVVPERALPAAPAGG